MTMKDHYPTYDRHADTVRMSGRWKCNSTTTPDNTLNKGSKGATVARTAAGTYVLTFSPDVGYELLHVDAKVWVPALATNNYRVAAGPYDASAKTLTLYLYDADGGGAADPAVDDDSWVSWEVTWQNSDVQ